MELLSFFDKFQKVKKVKEKPNVKQVKQRTANVIVYGLLLLFFFLGFFGSIRALGLSSQVSSLRTQVKDFEEVVQTLPENQEEIDVSKVRQYMVEFLKVYVNYSDETSGERLQKLSDFYSFGIEASDEKIKFPRTLTGQNMIGLTKEEDFLIADMKISYETVENGENVTRVRVLSVPFRTENGLFSVISLPFFKQEDMLIGQSEALSQKKIDKVEKVDEEIEQSVREFLGVFFNKYAKSNETDLALLMKEPYFMGGQYELSSIDDSSTLIYEEGDKIVVQTSVLFADKSEATHTENFTLYLVKQDSGWFVNELKHYFN